MTTAIDYFPDCIETVLRHEGGTTTDHAGLTKYGISLRFLSPLNELGEDGYQYGDLDKDGDIDADDIRTMSKIKAIEIYRTQWWDRYAYWNIEHLLIAEKTFDLAVNMGSRQAGRLVQRALRSAGSPVTVDGILGRISFGAMNTAPVYPLLAAIRSEAAGFYRTLAAQHPEFKKYLKGWENRAYD